MFLFQVYLSFLLERPTIIRFFAEVIRQVDLLHNNIPLVNIEGIVLIDEIDNLIKPFIFTEGITDWRHFKKNFVCIKFK